MCVKMKVKSQSLIKDQNGSALIICLLSLAVLSALGTAALMVSTTNQSIAGNYRKQSQAFFVAESGLQKAIAELRKDMAWRGETTVGSVPATVGDMVIGNITADYTVKILDNTDDTTLPGGHVKLISEGVFQDSTQTVETIVSFSPDDSSKANSPSAVIVTEGKNYQSGNHVINGYDDDGIENTDEMVLTEDSTPPATLPTVNQEALKAFADFIVEGDMTDGLGLNSFWKDPDTKKHPYIIYVKGDLNFKDNVHVYGIIFVEGEAVLEGAARVHGVIYAPNSEDTTEIKGGGNPNDQPIMGQLLCGKGGVEPADNHADVQLVKEYVDAFNNFGGAVVNVKPAPGSWRQY